MENKDNINIIAEIVDSRPVWHSKITKIGQLASEILETVSAYENTLDTDDKRELRHSLNSTRTAAANVTRSVKTALSALSSNTSSLVKITKIMTTEEKFNRMEELSSHKGTFTIVDSNGSKVEVNSNDFNEIFKNGGAS